MHIVLRFWHYAASRVQGTHFNIREVLSCGVNCCTLRQKHQSHWLAGSLQFVHGCYRTIVFRDCAQSSRLIGNVPGDDPVGVIDGAPFPERLSVEEQFHDRCVCERIDAQHLQVCGEVPVGTQRQPVSGGVALGLILGFGIVDRDPHHRLIGVEALDEVRERLAQAGRGN